MSTTTTEPLSTEDLFGQIVEGNEAAFEELYRLIGRTVRAKVHRDFRDDHEDVHHAVFMDVLAAIQAGTIRKPESLLAFVRTISMRHCVGLIRAKIFRREACSELTEHLCEGARPDEIVLSQERRRVALEAVKRLPIVDRRIIEQCYLAGLSKEEVMAESNLTETQFRLRKSRAVKKMKVDAAERIDGTRRVLLAIAM